VAAANKLGDTPLLAAAAAGNLELAEVLMAAGADGKAARADGANLLSLAIISKADGLIPFAFKHGSQRLPDQTPLDFNELAERFCDPASISAWVRSGSSPSELIGEIGALLSSAVDAPIKERLVKVRAWLTCHDVLQNPSRWPVPHTVEQLALQAPDGAFELPHATPKPATYQCLMKLKVEVPVMSITISPDGSILAYAVSPALYTHILGL